MILTHDKIEEFLHGDFRFREKRYEVARKRGLKLFIHLSYETNLGTKK